MDKQGYYFEDGIRTIDLVLVYNKKKLNQVKTTYLETFIQNILKAGLDVEIAPFSLNNNIKFVKIYASYDHILAISELVGAPLSFDCPNRRHLARHTPYFCKTVLTDPEQADDEIHTRMRQNGDNITSCEKIFMIYALLRRIKFAEGQYEFGIDRLVDRRIFTDAFCLHEGPEKWTEEGPLNDRQVLIKYWSNIGNWYKIQPIHLIERYFGTEYAFYFAWLGCYNRMLMFACIMSLLSIIYGLTTIGTKENQKTFEVCNSDLIICPKCHYQNCKYRELKSSCLYSYLVYVFDNRSTFLLSVLTACWSVIFVEIWKREESILQMQWNVDNLPSDKSARTHYIDSAKSFRFSEITKRMEPYIPLPIKVIGEIFALGSIAVLLGIMLMGAIAIMMYRVTMMIILARDTKEEIITQNTELIAGVTGAMISSIFINLFSVLYRYLAWYLTHLEHHKIQKYFSLSYIYKSFALACTSHYVTTFYIAFFKGQFFTHPGDLSVWSQMGGLASDTCDPTGCILDLTMSLICLMGAKIIYSNINQLLIPWTKKHLYIMAFLRNKSIKNLPIIEQEYLKPETDEFFLMDEYTDMVIQFGFLTFFVAGFPIAAVLAFVNNVIELRVDASKLLRIFRRPIPKKVDGLGPWLRILRGMAYFGIISNAAIISYTSDFAPREIYRYTIDDSLVGFSNYSISEYALEDFKIFVSRRSSELPKSCFYVGRRKPPGSPDKYEQKEDFWLVLAVRIIIFISIEVLVRFVNGILAYAIPDTPEIVTQEKMMQEREARYQMKMKQNESQNENKKES